MVRVTVKNPPRVQVKISGYTGEPTGSIELTENHKTYNVKPYAEAEVNVPDPVLIEKTITANGEYSAQADNADGYSDVTVALPFEQKTITPSTVQQDVTVTPNTQYQALELVTVEATPLESVTITPTTQQQTVTPTAPTIGFNSVTVEGCVSPVEKDVNFYDYDGTLLYGYTILEAQNLTTLPDVPVDGDYDIEWNWTLEKIKEVNAPVIVSAIYTRKDKKNCFVLEILTDNTTIPFKFNASYGSSYEIDWGDGTSDSASGLNGDVTVNHTYAKGVYQMKVYYPTGTITYKTAAFGMYNTALKEVEISCENVKVWDLSFLTSYALEKIKLSSNVQTLGTRAFAECYRLKFAGVPKNCTLDGASPFAGDSSMSKISLSYSSKIPYTAFQSSYSLSNIGIFGTSEISKSAFSNCYGLRTVIIGKEVEQIDPFAFSVCRCLAIVDLSQFIDVSSIPTLDNTNAFGNSYTIFYVANQEMLNAFSSATNWSTYADRFQIKGE